MSSDDQIRFHQNNSTVVSSQPSRHLGLDLVPRKDFEMVEEDRISVSDLYKMVRSSGSSDLWNILFRVQIRGTKRVWLRLLLGPFDPADDVLMLCCGLIFILLTHHGKVLTQQMCEEMKTACLSASSQHLSSRHSVQQSTSQVTQLRCAQPGRQRSSHSSLILVSSWFPG